MYIGEERGGEEEEAQQEENQKPAGLFEPVGMRTSRDGECNTSEVSVRIEGTE